MTITKKLNSTGSSRCLILSKEIRALLGIEEIVKITIKDNKMIIEKGD
jgi:hypothetical protein